MPEETVSANLIFGSAIHAAIEHHYREILAGSPTPELDALLDVYQENCTVRDLDAVKFGKEEDVHSLAALAEKMLAAFQVSDIARPAGQIIGIEEELRGEIPAGPPSFWPELISCYQTPTGWWWSTSRPPGVAGAPSRPRIPPNSSSCITSWCRLSIHGQFGSSSS